MAHKQQNERLTAKGSTRLVKFRLNEAEFEQATRLASQTYRSRALFVRTMYLLGLKEYQREHPLD
ncbi:hypothetical protein [Herbaspirillum rubrisubalbicans]|uniref:Ribbon-helix-helix protein, CopG family n=1 Tax=Herbaspirillum rubrisubalbicans TaxID=80842 RepID=A0AAD0U808_9BURK|nr:hypothetical protein [Herbaspirillum rubrisubalbicans]AYR23911.1 hypothetical protein RC54_08735 [Herbaspirillum rubrisubalbicans]